MVGRVRQPMLGQWVTELDELRMGPIKRVALCLMLTDHLNKYLLGGSSAALYSIGRVAMPLFVLVLAFNLARASCDASARRRVLVRLALAAAAATPFFMGLGGLVNGWWPLNFLFALLAMVAIVHLWEQGPLARVAAAAVFVVLGGLVEFWWPALVFGLAARRFFSRPGWPPLVVGLVGLAGVNVVNGNAWAVAALPLFAVLGRLPFAGRRAAWFFYAFYPLHLAALLAIRSVL